MLFITHEGGIIQMQPPLSQPAPLPTVIFEGQVVDHLVRKELVGLGERPFSVGRGRREVFFDYWRLIEDALEGYTPCYLERDVLDAV